MQKYVCYTSVCCHVLWVLTDGRNSRFYSREQLRASVVSRGVAEASGIGGVESSACGRGKVVSLTSILDQGQFF